MQLERWMLVSLCFMTACGGTGTGAMNGSATDPHGPKGDSGQLTEVEWANQYFLTQVMDPAWNPGGALEDSASNNCGPASLAMLMSSRGAMPPGMGPEMQIDHARALMHPGYPALDEGDLPEGAALLESEGVVFVDDDAHPVYFDWVADDASLPEGIMNGGGEPVTGFTTAEMNTLLDLHGSVIAHGHITPSWVARFDGEYGDVGTGGVSHFILIHRASVVGEYIVCDPMHRGGAVRMTSTALQAFFTSPVNVFEVSLRVMAWLDEVPSSPDMEQRAGQSGPQ